MDVFVISSEKSLNEISNALKEQGLTSFLPKILCSRKKGGEVSQTHKNLLFTDEKNAASIIQKTGFETVPYSWDSFIKPSEDKGETKNLHFTGLPRNLTDSEATQSLKACLSYLFSVYSDHEKKVHIKIDLLDRETGTIKGYGSINFDDDVSDDFRNLVKLMLNNTRISSPAIPASDKPSRIACRWQKVSTARYQNPRPSESSYGRIQHIGRRVEGSRYQKTRSTTTE